MKGFVRYYNTLSKVGYIDKSHVNNLIIGSWINKVLNGDYGILVNDEQYNMLSQLWICVVGDCLVPYSDYCTNVTINKMPITGYIRITETDSTNRMTENNNLRTL